MDSYQEQRKPNRCTGCFILILNVILAYIFFTYAYQNPDEGQCWACLDLTSFSVSATMKDDYTINVAKQFKTWFRYGFILNVFLI